MHVAVFERPDGDPASAVIKQVATPEAALGEVLIKVASAGLNTSALALLHMAGKLILRIG